MSAFIQAFIAFKHWFAKLDFHPDDVEIVVRIKKHKLFYAQDMLKLEVRPTDPIDSAQRLFPEQGIVYGIPFRFEVKPNE